MPENTTQLTPLQKAFLVIQDLQKRLNNVSEQGPVNNDIAVIGIACHLPGNINSAAQLWDALTEGRSLITDNGLINRWSGVNDQEFDTSKIVPHAGLLENIAGFDHDFFNISPTEAQYMDPQQRQMLMVAYKAFEDAGIASQTLKGSQTGMFIGASAIDYGLHIMQQAQQGSASPYLGSGNSLSGISGRLSYFFGCNGPSVSIDTACSSSMVALHQACISLQRNECNIALTGGVNFLLSAPLQESLTEAGMLSSDGSCKTFDESANGYVRSEGCIAIIIKKLSDAERDGNRIYACIKGTAVAQDGASGGMTVPNPVAQAAVIKQALHAAGVKAGDIDFLEAHGTGTSLGDPIEMEGLRMAFGERTADKKMRIGSVKTNLGHLEAAAGLAGVIKTCLSLYYSNLPKHLHYNVPNKHIEWQTLPVELNTGNHDFIYATKPLLAGISSFGFTGTIAHTIIEQYKAQSQEPVNTGESYTLVIWAKSLEALNNLRTDYINYLQTKPYTLADICYTAAHKRNNYKYALLAKGNDTQAIIEALKNAESQIDLLFDINQIPAGKIVSLPYYPFKLTAHWVGSLPGHIHASNQYNLTWLPVKQSDKENMVSEPGHYIYVNPSAQAVFSYLDTNTSVTPVYYNNELGIAGNIGINDEAGLTAFFSSTNQQYDTHPVHIIYDVTSLTDSENDHDFNSSFEKTYQSAITFLKTLAASQLKPASFTLLTQQAVIVNDSDTIISPLQYSLRGWLKSVSLELPQLQVNVFDLPSAITIAQLAKINFIGLMQQGYYQQLALRNNQLYYEALTPQNNNKQQSQITINNNGVYLVTGGTGSLGLHIAEWLLAQNAYKVILASRNPTQPLLQTDNHIVYARLDVGNKQSVTELSYWLTSNNLQLKGIIHAAGISHRQQFTDITWADIEKAAQSKVKGLRNLCTVLPLQELDFFVGYSSIASVWGSTMLSHYAAANAYMDAYVSQLRLTGIAAKVINWGPWADSNMMLQDQNSTSLLRESGIVSHHQQTVFSQYGQLLHPQNRQEVYVQLNRQRFTAIMELKKPSAFWNKIRPTQKQAQNIAAGTTIQNNNFEKLQPAERYKKILQILNDQLKLVLAIDASTDIDNNRNFSEMGMDSILIIRFIEKLKDQFTQPVTTNMIFNFHTTSLLSQHINNTFFITQQPQNATENQQAVAVTNIEAHINMLDNQELHDLINADIQKYF